MNISEKFEGGRWKIGNIGLGRQAGPIYLFIQSYYIGKQRLSPLAIDL
jgi:hypothetical protein